MTGGLETHQRPKGGDSNCKRSLQLAKTNTNRPRGSKGSRGWWVSSGVCMCVCVRVCACEGYSVFNSTDL